jgi:hypothetical protein
MTAYSSYTTRAQHLLASLRHHRVPIRQLDMRPYWRGCALSEFAGEPMTVRRARALEAVLSRMNLLVRDEDLIVGTPAGCMAECLPDDSDPKSLEQYKNLNDSTGERGFWTNFDHLAPDYRKLVTIGLVGLLAETQAYEQTQSDSSRITFLQSVRIALQAVTAFINRLQEGDS